MTTINKHEVLINAYIPELFKDITKLKLFKDLTKLKLFKDITKLKLFKDLKAISKLFQDITKPKLFKDITKILQATVIQRYHKAILKLFKDIKKAIQKPLKANPKLSQR